MAHPLEVPWELIAIAALISANRFAFRFAVLTAIFALMRAYGWALP